MILDKLTSERERFWEREVSMRTTMLHVHVLHVDIKAVYLHVGYELLFYTGLYCGFTIRIVTYNVSVSVCNNVL